MGKKKRKKVMIGEHGQRIEVKSGFKPQHLFMLLLIIAMFSLLIYKGYSIYNEFQEDEKDRIESKARYQEKKATEGKDKAAQGKF